MKVSAFCPGHVSCVFQPIKSYDDLSTGSRGFGIRLSKGAHATVEMRDDDVVNIYMDGVKSVAHVTRMAAQSLAPGVGFEISIENDLPVSQGFGMSAAGAISASLCIADLMGMPRTKAFMAAHVAEVNGGGGLGDVAAIVAGRDVPIRTVPGIPPFGRVESAGLRLEELTLAVIGRVMKTDSVLGDPNMVSVIRTVGDTAMDMFLGDPSVDNLYATSNWFSERAGVESAAVRKAIIRLQSRGYRAGMCMLGNSIFTDAPEDVVYSVLGRGGVKAFRCPSSSKETMVTRRE